MRLMCKGKIHRATVTDANLNYVGSITIDETLMLASDIREYEQVHVLNVNNGERFLTYAITGKADSGIICVNGAASRLVQPGDLVIILSYSWYQEEALSKFVPKHIHVNLMNKIKEHHLIEEEMAA